MHLLDVERRFYGGWGIVGGHLPIAVGAALALDQTETPRRRPVPVRRRRDEHRRLPRVAQPRRDLEPADRLPDHQQPVRHGHVGRRRRRPSRSSTAAPPPTGCTASASTATTSPPCARRPGGCCATARDERRPSVLECMTYRIRGHSVADAGKAYRTKDEIDEWRHARPDRALRARRDRGGPAHRGRDRRRSARRSPTRSRRRSARPPPRPSPIPPRSPTTSTATRTPRSSSTACASPARSASGKGRAHGERDLPRGAAPRARRGARARRAGVPDGRGDRPLRRLVQGHRRASGRSTAPSACARRRSRRRASSAPASARPCSACGPSSRS